MIKSSFFIMLAVIFHIEAQELVLSKDSIWEHCYTPNGEYNDNYRLPSDTIYIMNNSGDTIIFDSVSVSLIDNDSLDRYIIDFMINWIIVSASQFGVDILGIIKVLPGDTIKLFNAASGYELPDCYIEDDLFMQDVLITLFYGENQANVILKCDFSYKSTNVTPSIPLQLGNENEVLFFINGKRAKLKILRTKMFTVNGGCQR